MVMFLLPFVSGFVTAFFIIGFSNKEIYCLFKTYCIISVLFSTKCY